MPSKSELQTVLKERYGINKNISQSLATEDCEQLIATLQGQPSMVKLVESFATKNADLGQNNRYHGQRRSQAEKKLKAVQAECSQLERQITNLEQNKGALVNRKQALSDESKALESEIHRLTTQNKSLSSKVQSLTTHNDELLDANEQLKKDNKDLKNVVDQIRLRLARDTKTLLQYEDSEIRKALIRLFRWTLG
ncbi:MAG: hypothetical protein AAGF01_15405 [Cyanobacteria bacterium P01_G01_bin.38]